MKFDVGLDALYDVFAGAVQHAMPLVIQGGRAGGRCVLPVQHEAVGVPQVVAWSPLSRLLRVRGAVGVWEFDVSDLDRVWLVGQLWGRNCGWRLLLEQHTDIGLH